MTETGERPAAGLRAARCHEPRRGRRPAGAAALAGLASAALLALALSVASCSQGGGSSKNPALDGKLERLLALILDVERRGASDDDSAAVEANRIIAEFGGPDSTARILSERLIRNADRWVPILDSLARVPAATPAVPIPTPAPGT